MADSTATLLSPLLKCFHSVPPAAIPAMLDCVLASSNISPPLLFDSLLSSFSIVIDGIDKDTDKLLGSEQCKILVAYSRSLSHLIKTAGVCSIALESFTWKAFVPLLKMGNLYGRETLNEIQDSFLETVNVNNSWAVVKATLVPFLLRSVDISMDSLQNTLIIERSKHGSDVKFHAPVGGEDLLSVSSSFPLSISCHMLSSLLDAALQSFQAHGSFLDLPRRGGSSAEVFFRSLLWDLCDITIRMLPQSSAHRSCAVGLLFPTILNAFADVSSFEVTAGEKTFNLSRNYFLRKMWECCSVLFSLGHVERRDAYGLISLYLSYVPCVDRFEVEVIDRAEEFDITAEKQFWDEIKRGLVSKESLVRKQSLQILEKVLLIKDETHSNSNIPDKKSHHKGPVPVGMTKRDVWAEKEAMSLGVGKISTALDPSLSEPQKWKAFIIVYEMLEEYGTHLVEAAWNHQIVLLLNSCQQDRPLNSAYWGFGWLAILWERGLFHENPLVRCLIMESFLDFHWENQINLTQLFSEDFLLGPFVEGLNDPVHHKDFGVKGIYTSMTIVGASLFLQRYCSLLSERSLLSFLSKLASVAKWKSLGRAGLMALADCIYSASNCSTVSMAEKDSNGRYESKCEMDELVNSDGVGSLEVGTCNEKTNLIDGLRLLIEVSKQHFNPCYRLKVCEKLVRAGALVVCTHELPLEMLLLFVAALPRDFIDAGPLRSQLQGWLLGCGKKDCIARCTRNKMQLQLRLLEFPKEFTSQTYHADFLGEYDDDDIIAWGTKSERWARVLFLLIKEKHPLQALFLFLKEIYISINQKNNSLRWIPVKFLIIISSMVHELEIMWRKADPGLKLQDESGVWLHEEVYRLEAVEASLIQISSENFLFVLEELTSFAITSCSIFWSGVVGDTVDLPGAVIGKLGGPSQRRLSSSLTTTILQAIMSVKTAACLSSWCSRARENIDLIVPHTFLWEFIWKAVSRPMCETETSAEIQLATYEALGSVLKALAPMFSSLTIKLIQKANGVSSPPEETMPLLDCLVLSFLTHCNELLGSGQLARSRVAVLLNWKWLCIESLLSMPYHALQNGVDLRSTIYFFSSNVVECIFYDLVESLENAADDSALPMLRSVRLVLDMLTTDGPFLSSRCMVDVKMMWQFVRSSWILHSSCKKRRVAPISALLSSVLHASVFRNESMHVTDNADGPLKWFCGKVLEEGTKSPRTIRLAALHLTGLWLLNPLMIKHYVKELKVFTLYGSVAFDEDFESELTENDDARAEVSLLAKSPDPEITEVFINTELYARVSVAVLFHKLGGLAKMVGSENKNEDSRVALEAGKLFLLALLDSVVNDNDLAKELYKKYSAIHRRKVRVWQMLCILSPFVDEDVIQHVMHGLHTAIQRNNLPSVRQYMESFAINLYLKFPHLVKEHLVPLLSDYHMKTQALASYVFIAANVILHASEALQSRHLEKLLPPIVPLLTSHHHTLRGFTQLLVFKVLSEKLPALETTHFEMVPLEKKCFADLKLYLGLNPDCVRLRSSMEAFLDTFDPKHAVTPAGIFSNRVEALEFECVSMSLMEQVINFLNDAREDLRDAIAKDDVAIKNESLKSAAYLNLTSSPVRQSREELSGYPQIEAPLDFQKKFTLLKHEKENDSSRSLLYHLEIYKPLAELEKEDKLLVQMLQSRVSPMEKLRANRQEFILVASLIDRIPNLAGLARTCEVFKATGLVVADAKVLQDRQFQLISVTAEKWIPIVEVPVKSVKAYLEKKKREGFSILGLEQTANSIPLDKYEFPKKTVLVLGREKEGIPVDIIHILDACLEIPQLGVVRSLNVHVSRAIALWEYTRQQRAK